MGRPRYDSGLCYDAASAPDERRLAGPAGDVPPADWTAPGVSNTPWTPGGPGTFVDEWDGVSYPGAQLAGAGDDITKDTPVPGTATLDDAGGAFTADHVGRKILIAGATAPANDGLYNITAVNSPTQLEYDNALATTVVGDGFTYAINPADLGYGPAKGPGVAPTKSWRFDVELPDGWYTRSTRSRKVSGEQ